MPKASNEFHVKWLEENLIHNYIIFTLVRIIIIIIKASG